jgi:hypothetical protein
MLILGMGGTSFATADYRIVRAATRNYNFSGRPSSGYWIVKDIGLMRYDELVACPAPGDGFAGNI